MSPKTRYIKFRDVPEGTEYSIGASYHVPEADAKKYVADGLAVENVRSPNRPEPADSSKSSSSSSSSSSSKSDSKKSS